MSDSCKDNTDSQTKRARRRRLEIQRMRSSTLSPAESSGNKCGGFVYGHVSMMGRRRVMEDTVIYNTVIVAPLPGKLAEEYAIFAVYDGHSGAKVAEKCSERLEKCLTKHIESKNVSDDEEDHVFDWEKMMVECFSGMDNQESFDEENISDKDIRVGSPDVSVVVVCKDDLVVANCGESKAVLCRGGLMVPLSNVYQGDKLDESKRAEFVGEKIMINRNECRVQGVLLDTSRSTGDLSEPEVTIERRTESDDFLIIATDGLWGVLCTDIACEIVKKSLLGRVKPLVTSSEECGASEAAAMLVELAIAKGSKDNITVIVVELK